MKTKGSYDSWVKLTRELMLVFITETVHSVDITAHIEELYILDKEGN